MFFSFEPNKVFKLLEINASSVENVEPLNLGLSDTKEALKAFVDKGNLSSGRITDDLDSNELKVEKL